MLHSFVSFIEVRLHLFECPLAILHKFQECNHAVFVLVDLTFNDWQTILLRYAEVRLKVLSNVIIRHCTATLWVYFPLPFFPGRLFFFGVGGEARVMIFVVDTFISLAFRIFLDELDEVLEANMSSVVLVYDFKLYVSVGFSGLDAHSREKICEFILGDVHLFGL